MLNKTKEIEMAEYKHLLNRPELLRRFMAATIFLSCALAPGFVRAQSHEESCRAARLNFEEYKSQDLEDRRHLDFKKVRPDYWRDNLSTLNKAVTNNLLLPRTTVKPWADEFGIEMDEEERMTVAERFEFQERLRTEVVKEFQTVASMSAPVITKHLSWLLDQEKTQLDRLTTLQCDGYGHDLKPPASTTFSVDGTWKCDDGGTYVLQQFGTVLFWEATSPDAGQTWAHRFEGRIEGNVIKGSFKDHPPGAIRQTGDLAFKIISNNQIERTYASVGYGCNHLVRQ